MNMFNSNWHNKVLGRLNFPHFAAWLMVFSEDTEIFQH